MPLAALFSAITLAFAGIALWTAEAHKWVIAVAAAALAAWMATLAWSAVRKSRS
jgi:heme O synthase-like polyprenyltransferase